MSETPETPIARASTSAVPASEAPHRTPRVFQVAAWVAIVAGTVFVVAVVFFTGFVLGRHAGGHCGWHPHGHDKHRAAITHPRGPGGPGGGPAAFPGGGGPEMMRPGHGAGNGPARVPSSVSPSVTPSP